MNKKIVVIALTCVLLVCCVVGGTMAWLTAGTGEVKNTFTVGDINIELNESGAVDEDATGNKDNVFDKAYDFVPGDVLIKDPLVTVKANSEKCYVFIKAVESNNNINNVHEDDIIVWTVNTNIWTPVDGHPSYWYKIVDKSSQDQKFTVLVGNQVTVSTAVTKEMVGTLREHKPTLSFQAAAVQVKNLADKSNEALAEKGTTNLELAFAQAKF